MFISLVIPVYNRPQEVRELLESLTHQTRRDFETVVVEDGSAPELSSDGVVREYADRLDICYVRQPSGGPAAARNTGAAHAHGDFLVIMDSDCIVPPGYFETVYAEVEARGIAFYGGPDMAAPDFSPLQKAVSYSMTSVFTTGGIRGNRRSIGKFSPRSFNLGISRPLFEQVGASATCASARISTSACVSWRPGHRPGSCPMRRCATSGGRAYGSFSNRFSCSVRRG